MNVCFEAIASVWVYSKKQIMSEPVEQQIFTAQDNLEQCRKSMELRERELQDTIARLAKEAVARKKAGDLPAARLKAAERSRALKRLDKLRSSMNIIDTQLDTIKSTELDKEIMMSLKASSTALKKAGIAVKATEVENVMNELDDHMKEMQDISSVLANPVTAAFEDEADLDNELASLLEEENEATESKHKAAVAVAAPQLSRTMAQPASTTAAKTKQQQPGAPLAAAVAAKKPLIEVEAK